MLFLTKRNQVETESIPPSNQQIDGEIQVASDQIKGIVEQVKLASLELEQISSSSKEKTNKLNIHSEQTANNIQQVFENMKEIESSALHISSFSQEILSNTQESYSEINVSVEAFESLQQKFVELSNNHQRLLSQMNQLVVNSEKIQNIVHTIGSISQKTKILALNATIEAARAGTEGKGFTVVAREVGNLANQTSQAVEETRDTIQVIQNEIELSRTMVEGETKQVEEGSNKMGQIIQSLQSFKEHLHFISKMVEESTGEVDEQKDSIQEISHLLQEISEMAMKNKEYTSQVTDDFNKQHHKVEEIRTISDSLNVTSSKLQGLVHHDIEKIQIDKQLVNQLKQSLSQYVHSDQLISMDLEIVRSYLDQMKQTHKEIETIWVNRLDGTFLYSQPKEGIINAKMRPWFKEAKNGKEYVSQPYISAVTKKQCITFSFPIYNNNEMVGIFGADLSI